jgi:hypothetical protein
MFTPPPLKHVTCHVSHVTCPMSRVICHNYFIYFFFGQSGEAYRWRVCYQGGLPRLVLIQLEKVLLNLLIFLAILVHNSAHHYIRQCSVRTKQFTFRRSATSQSLLNPG